MNAETSISAAWIFICVLLIIEPWFARRNVLFGVVFGNDDIWKSEWAKKIRTRYLLVMVIGTVIITLILLAYCFYEKISVASDTAPFLIGIFALLLYSAAVFAIYHAKTLSMKNELGADEGLVSDRVSVDTSIPERKTVISASWLLLMLPVLLASYGVAYFGYASMPSELPTHYSFTAVDAWAPKSWQTVLMPLIIGTALTAIMFVCCIFTRRAPASVRGNPEAAPEAYRFRKYMIILIIILSILMETSFLMVEIGFITPLSPLLFRLQTVLDLVVTAAIFVIYLRFVRAKKPKGQILDDDARWILGMFYYNPSDSSVFIEKRSGIGYTLNFARPLAWLLMVGILGIIIFTLVFKASKG